MNWTRSCWRPRAAARRQLLLTRRVLSPVMSRTSTSTECHYSRWQNLITPPAVPVAFRNTALAELHHRGWTFSEAVQWYIVGFALQPQTWQRHQPIICICHRSSVFRSYLEPLEGGPLTTPRPRRRAAPGVELDFAGHRLRHQALTSQFVAVFGCLAWHIRDQGCASALRWPKRAIGAALVVHLAC